MWPGRLLAVLAVVGVAGAPGAVRAHEARLGMATETVVLRVEGGRRKLTFEGFGPGLAPAADEDPAGAGAALLVLGGTDAGRGRSALVALDPARWTRGARGGALAYVYRDRRGRRGGVRKVVFARGALTVKAGGPRLGWAGPAPADDVQVLFRVGREWHCALAPGVARRGRFHGRDAFAPAACAPLVCGNGVRELGEGCDDGNLDDADACTNACVRGACTGTEFATSWDALRAVVFERHGCTEAVCHGGVPGAGGLSLAGADARARLVDVPATGSAFPLIVPGAPRRSALWLKLAAKVAPGSVEVPGEPMPSGLPPIGEDELEALRLWIYAGAPETGVVEGVQDLLDTCLPEPTPIAITPLPPPAPGTGVQFRMPEVPLAAHSETEVCFASWYDFTDQVPPEFVDPTGQFFYVNGMELRQDPHSHHLQILHSGAPASLLHDSAFGAWTCKGGASDGAPCEPTEHGACGAGLCASAIVPSVACIGYGPPGYAAGLFNNLIGGAQSAQAYDPGRAGFYGRIPLKGLLYWNTHAFNLTGADTRMHAYSNHLFTADLRFQGQGIFDLSTLYLAAGTPPFTERTVCGDYELPRWARLLWLSSHTHKRARRFWIDLLDGTRLYESFTYADPETAGFDPPLPFDAVDAEARTLHYCAVYNNGVAADGSPDPAAVRRRSTTPPNGVPCAPVACAAGRVGAPCGGVGDDAACDTIPGAGDGRCDACPITAGVTTEDEMFLLLGGFMVTPP